MKPKPILLTLLISLLLTSATFGDSALTSTNFSLAYAKEPIMVKASKAQGLITDELMDYLIGANNPIPIKMAIINKTGWDIKGKANSVKFLNYLKNNKGYSSEVNLIKRGTGDEHLCLAYIKAIDNYSDVNDAIKYSEDALTRNNKSYSYQIIEALINAQKVLGNDKNWCQVYRLTNDVRKNTTLTRDMNDEAISIIFEY